MPIHANADKTNGTNANASQEGPTRANPLKGKSYEEGSAALSPRAQPTFDNKWELTPAEKALFVELQTADKKRSEVILNDLVKTHKVDKKVVEAVIEANKTWYATTWSAIKGGSWHTVGTDKDGNITHEFKLDGKAIGWENVDHKVDVNIKKKSVGYTNKEDEWSLVGGYDKRGTVDFQKGNKKDGLSEYHVEAGGDGAAAHYRHTEGDQVTYGRGAYGNANNTHSLTGEYTEKDGKDLTTYKSGVHYGQKTGADGRVIKNREGYNLNTGMDASRTTTDAATTDTLGGDATYTKKPKEGEATTVSVKVRATETDKANGQDTTNLTAGGGIKQGSAAANVNWSGTTGVDGAGTSYRVDDIKADAKDTWVLDKETQESFSLGLAGHLRMTDQTGQDTTWRGELNGLWKKGKKKTDGYEEFNFKLRGGHESLSTATGLGHADKGIFANGTDGYADYGQLGLGLGRGKNMYQFDTTLATSDTTQFAGAHLGWSHTDGHNIDLFASAAKQDDDVGQYFRATSKFALSKSLTLGAGGSYLLKPTDEGHQELWNAHVSMGIALKKDSSIELKLGVAGDGENMYYVPEAMYKFDKKLSLSALGNISSTGEYGAAAKLKYNDISVIGGYGNSSMLANPYAGNAGMAMHNRGGDDYMGRGDGQAGAFIGVQWNALPTIKKVLGLGK